MSHARFAKVSTTLDFPEEERAILRLWKERGIFAKTLAKPATRGTFVFYEGPPTANGMPHNGHVLTRVIKDVFPRYRTMRGWRVPRKAGWDTHGLPVEVEVEKELRLHGKAAIEAYGVEPFVRRCVESVFRYTREWEELTERVAFWVDMQDAYVTYHRSYVESVWWALAELFKKGLLYQGHKVVWWWAQGGTALSSNEVGQGYRVVDDPSVYVAFPLVGYDDLSLLVWTTTPWTLPSNMYAAVHPDLEYVVVRAPSGKRYVVARGLVETLAAKLGELAVERSLTGASFVGEAYRPPFDLFAAEAQGFEDVVWRVIAADFVTLDAGTGIVHIAPAFGEDDHEAHRRVLRDHPSVPLFCAVMPDGRFVDRFERYAGRWVKDCDKEIQHDLKDGGVLVFAEQYRHEYPFCWRADSDPLIQYARPAWYIRTTAMIDRAIANNRAVRWFPDHIRDGRFGDFLANNVDWALSRERWWGTPLNVWVCDADPDHKEAPSSIADIEARNPRAFDHFRAARAADPKLSEHLIIHKPWVDQVTFACGRCGTTMRRVSEVIDCWFDSGCMPFAQWGYPHAAGSRERFESSFPADFISEAIDQTRGWFYSLLMISTLLHDSEEYPHPFKTCMVLGHVTDKEGKKESKSKGNYTPPEIILDRVAMEFAVVDAGAVPKAGPVTPGHALIAPEDLEGLDLRPGAPVRAARVDRGDVSRDLKLVPAKGLKRRQAVMHADDLAVLGIVPTSKSDVLPPEVGRLPREQRVVIEDPLATAPGADAFRWFFYAASPPWSATRHSLSNVRALQKEFAIKLRNVYSFFTIYANIDGFDPTDASRMRDHERGELERWILGELALTVRDVTASMDDYDVYGATQRLVAFVDALSNWYVRLSRALFWKDWNDPIIKKEDKRSAYETLYRCLVSLSRLTAPFTPYAAESMYQNLVVQAGVAGARESVHLEDWPEADVSTEFGWEHIHGLSRKVATVRYLASLGLKVRNVAKIKVRQPLSEAHVITARFETLDAATERQISQELNVGATLLVPLRDARKYVEFRLKPNFRSLGQRGLGKSAQGLKRLMAEISSDESATLALSVMAGEVVVLGGVELHREDVEIEFTAKAGFAAAGDPVGVVVLDTRLTPQLRRRGLLWELINRIQARRKELGLEYTDRIEVRLGGSALVMEVAQEHEELFSAEVLASAVRYDVAPAHDDTDVDIEGEVVRLGVRRVDAVAPGGTVGGVLT